MIAMLMSELMSELMSASLVAADDGGATWMLVLGPAGAGGVYYGLWSYYRNTGKSHSFERETRIGAKPVTGNDRKVDEITGTKRSSIEGDNHTSHRDRVQRVP